jgi:hypothetical protein
LIIESRRDAGLNDRAWEKFAQYFALQKLAPLRHHLNQFRAHPPIPARIWQPGKNSEDLEIKDSMVFEKANSASRNLAGVYCEQTNSLRQVIILQTLRLWNAVLPYYGG